MQASSSRTRITETTAALFACLCGVYVILLSPSVGWRDAGELTASSFHLGIAHPTGFPVVLVLGKAFALLVPVGNVAMRIGLASAVLMAAAVTIMSRLAHDVVAGSGTGTGRLAPLAAGAAVALGGLLVPALGAFAANAEVYAFAAACAAGSAFLVVSSARSGDPRPGVLAALLAGVSAGCHVAAGLASGIAVAAFLIRSPGRGPRLLALTAAAALAGAAAILYLPARSWASPPVMWDDLGSASALWRHVSAGRIREAFASRTTGASLPGDCLSMIRFLAAHAGPLPFALAPAGVILAARRSMVAALLLGLMAVADVLYSVLLNPMAIAEGQDGTIALLACLGLAGIAIGEATVQSSRVRGWAGPVLAGAAIATLALSAPRAPSPTGRDDLPSAWAGAVLRALPPGALMMCTSDDLCGIVLYLQRVEGERPDAGILPRQHLWHEITIRQALGRSHPGLEQGLLGAPVSVAARLAWLARNATGTGLFWEMGDTADIAAAFGQGPPPLDLGPGSSPPVARVDGTDALSVEDVGACVDRLRGWLELTGHDPGATTCEDLGTAGCRALARDFLGLGLLLYARGDAPAAVEAFRVSAAVKPGYAPALANLARLESGP